MDYERIDFNTKFHTKLDKIVGAYHIPEYEGVFKLWNKTSVRQKTYGIVARWIWGQLYKYDTFGNTHESARKHVVYYAWDKLMDEIHRQKLGASDKTAKWVKWIYELGPPNTVESSNILFQNLERLLILQYGNYYIHDTFHSDTAVSNWWHTGGAKTLLRTIERIGTENSIGEVHSDLPDTFLNEEHKWIKRNHQNDIHEANYWFWKRGFNVPGYNYLGPGNGIDNGPVVNELDALAKKHDEAYQHAITQEDIKKADEEFINEINKKQTLPWAKHIAKYGIQLKQIWENKFGVVYPKGLPTEKEYTDALTYAKQTDHKVTNLKFNKKTGYFEKEHTVYYPGGEGKYESQWDRQFLALDAARDRSNTINRLQHNEKVDDTQIKPPNQKVETEIHTQIEAPNMATEAKKRKANEYDPTGNFSAAKGKISSLYSRKLITTANKPTRYDATNPMSGAKPDFRGPIGYKNKIQSKRNKVMDYETYHIDYFTYQFKCEDEKLSHYIYEVLDSAQDNQEVLSLAALSHQTENHQNDIRCEPINFNANRFFDKHLSDELMADAATNRSGFQKARVTHLNIVVKFYPRYVDKKAYPYIYMLRGNVPDQIMFTPENPATIDYATKAPNVDNFAYYSPYTEFSAQLKRNNESIIDNPVYNDMSRTDVYSLEYSKSVKDTDCMIYLFRDYKLAYARQSGSTTAPDLFTIKSPTTKAASQSRKVDYLQKEFPDQSELWNSNEPLNVEIGLPMDGQRAFDHIGIKAIRNKAYLPLNEFVYAIEGIKSTSDEYTTTELDSYNYMFAPLLGPKQYAYYGYEAIFPAGSSSTTICIPYYPVECSFTVEYSAAFHLYDYADVPYTTAPIGRDGIYTVMDPRAGLSLTRAEIIAENNEKLKKHYSAVTPWALPEKVKDQTMKIMPEINPPQLQVDLNDYIVQNIYKEEKDEYMSDD